mmetsp:Transcript_26225/g.30938  ORF Transcript_26225/g.30938 Transcript_26225/m.30938 type:complete len:274 (-) Transcript_26225:263-1084(-)
MLVMRSATVLLACCPPSGNSLHSASRNAQAMVALSPCRSPSDIIGLITFTVSASRSASLDPFHWAKLRTTKSEKSSRLLEVHLEGGVMLLFLRLSTTHLQMSVLPNRIAFSSLLARFLMRPHAHRTPSDLPDPDLETVGQFANNFSNTRMSESGLESGGMTLPSEEGECLRIDVILASRKLKFIRQIQQRYDSCLSSAITLQRPPITSFAAGPSAMTRLFSVGMDRLFSARQARCRPSPDSWVRHLARGVRTSHFPEQTMGTRFCLWPTSHSS